MKKFIALIFALFSGLYFVFGWIPDLVPFVDEAMALAIFVKSMSVLGFDVSRFLPFVRKKGAGMKPDGKVVDI
jgi:hypothetical protein